MANQSLPVVDSLHFSCLPGGQNACQCAHRILISPKRKNQLDEDEVDMVYSHYLRSFENYVSASEAMLNRLSGRDQLTLHTMTQAARREYEKMMTTANDYQEALERNRKRFEEKVEKFSKTPGLRRTMKRKTAVSPINQKRAVVVRLRQMVRQFDWEANEFRGHILSYERKATKERNDCDANGGWMTVDDEMAPVPPPRTSSLLPHEEVPGSLSPQYDLPYSPNPSSEIMLFDYASFENTPFENCEAENGTPDQFTQNILRYTDPPLFKDCAPSDITFYRKIPNRRIIKDRELIETLFENPGSSSPTSVISFYNPDSTTTVFETYLVESSSDRPGPSQSSSSSRVL